MKKIYLALALILSVLKGFSQDQDSSCHANFVYSYDAQSGSLYLFNTSEGEDITAMWTFLGTVSYEQNPIIVLPPAGVSVCLSIFSSTGCADSTCQFITIEPQQYCNASFTYNPMLGGSVIIPNAPYSPNYTYSWSTTAGQISTGYTFEADLQNGWNQVCLLVFDGASCSEDYCDSIFVDSVACSAGFAVSIGQNSLFEAQFLNESSGTGPYSYLWEFGDGAVSTEQGPWHTYQDEGIYLACLTITNSSGCSDQYCMNVTIDDFIEDECEAGFNYSNVESSPFTIQFTGVYNANQVEYHHYWHFGADGFSADAYPQYTFPGPGEYTVCHSVYNNALDCMDSICTQVYINTCAANFAYYINPENQLQFQFVNISSDSAGTAAWTFGDGITSTGQNPVHIFAGAGEYTVCISISNPMLGCGDEYCATVVVGADNPTCNAEFNWYGDTLSGGAIEFEAVALSAGLIHSWQVSDGQTGTGPNPVLQLGPGTYTVCHIVISNTQFCADTTCAQITIGAPGCDASFTWEQQGSADTSSFHFIGVYTANQTDYQHYWNFGDGTVSDAANPIHIFPAPGAYTVCHWIQNQVSGCQDSICTAIFYSGDNVDCNAEFSITINPTTGYVVVSSANQENSLFHIYTWPDGQGQSQGNVTFEFPLPVGTHTVCHTIYSADSVCYATVCHTITVVDQLFTLQGQVWAGNIVADLATVYLYRVDTTSEAVTLINQVSTDAGSYAFIGLIQGTYLVRAELQDSSAYYADYVSTYFGEQYYWQDAQPIVISNGDSFDNNIALIFGENDGGSGFVGGNIDDGVMKLSAEGATPVAGARVIITDLNNIPQRWIESDASGNFMITDIAYGTYLLWADVPGIICIPIEFTLSPDVPGVDIMVILGDVTSVVTPVTSEISSELYPNPASERVNLKLNLKNPGSVSVAVCSLTGQVIRNENINAGTGIQTIEIPLQGVAAGTYLISIRNNSNDLIGVRRLTVTK